jgi:D-glycero-D-manno-heptose 1,7-bisphosphate phosphatase|tara:strand:+ start:3850 stop:4431 length:582 start_codon:yes stop_codon:yes gene_type:complete
VSGTHLAPTVFLDRDGTLIEEVGYLSHLDRIVLYPWSIESVKLLNRAGFKVVVVTNQAGVARGLFDEDFIDEAHRFLDQKFSDGGATIDKFYYCPHHPEASVEAYRSECDCRKPKAGMLWKAAQELQLELSHSFVIGDRLSDLRLGQAVGARSLLVRTGYGETTARELTDDVEVAYTAPELMTAVAWILRHST